MTDLKTLFDKIEALPPWRLIQVESYVDVVSRRARKDREEEFWARFETMDDDSSPPEKP